MAEVLVALYDADTYGRFDEAMADQACRFVMVEEADLHVVKKIAQKTSDVFGLSDRIGLTVLTVNDPLTAFVEVEPVPIPQ